MNTDIKKAKVNIMLINNNTHTNTQKEKCRKN